MTRPRVFVVGAATDSHVAAVAQRLGARAYVLDTRSFPATTRISATDDLESVVVEGEHLERPSAVYLRGFCASPHHLDVDADEAMAADWSTTLVAFGEKATLLQGLVARWEALGVPIYNPPSLGWRLAKPGQLALLKAAGLPVPETLWTNDPEAAVAFAKGRRVAYKPVGGGAATQELTDDDLTPERLACLAAAPVTFQELLPGEDLRVYVLDGEVVGSFRIVSSALDFRGHERAIESCTLPAELARQCLVAAQTLGLRWTGIDVKHDGEGRPRFLEANSSPMVLGFDAGAGTDVLGRLVEVLRRAS